MSTVLLKSNTQQRDPYVDILKGIGIVSIVIGHSAPIVIPAIGFDTKTFVYGYHIMIFMFVLGFLFRRTEENAPPFLFIGKTVFSMGKLFLTYSTLFFLFHNLLYQAGFFPGDPMEFKYVASGILNSAMFICEESLAGAMWFVPMYVVASTIFSVLFYLAEKTKRPVLTHLFFVLATMLIGVWMNTEELWFMYHMQTAVLSIPVCYLGFFCKKYWAKVSKCVTWYGTIIAAVTLHFLVTTKYGGIELADSEIISPFLFYPATLVGIYFCLGLAKLLSLAKGTRALFAYIGRNSFHIMALHFFAIKLVDVLYGLITAQEIAVYAVFPFAFDLWYLYYPIGVFLPLGLIELCKWIKGLIQKGIQKAKQPKEQPKTV